MMMDVGEIGHFEFCSDKLKIENMKSKARIMRHNYNKVDYMN
jgi:hypothetical protein